MLHALAASALATTQVLSVPASTAASPVDNHADGSSLTPAQDAVVQRAYSEIENTDREPILQHLTRGNGTAMDLVRAQIALQEYKRFLKLTAKYPSACLAPDDAADSVWHSHILHTRQYARDCQRIFGRIIHHDPAAEANSTMGIEAATTTRELYRREFGQDINVTVACLTCVPLHCKSPAA